MAVYNQITKAKPMGSDHSNFKKPQLPLPFDSKKPNLESLQNAQGLTTVIHFCKARNDKIQKVKSQQREKAVQTLIDYANSLDW